MTTNDVNRLPEAPGAPSARTGATGAEVPRGAAVTGKRNIEAVYPLSPMQQGMLFHSLVAPGSGVYCEQLTCALRGDLSVEAFRRAWQTVIERHAVLRTSFAWKRTEKPVQAVAKEVRAPLAELDWRDRSPAGQAAAFEEFLAADRQAGFDLSRAPLLRLTLIRVADEVHRLVWSHHHILLDGWSMPLLFGEVFALYEGYARGHAPALPATRPYKDYIAWLQAQDQAAAEAYWRQALRGVAGPTPLGVEGLAAPAGAVADRTSGRTPPREQEVRLSAECTAALQALARQERVTLSTIVQAAWALLLSRYSGEDDVLFGATVAGRPPALAGSDRMVGLLINTLPVRVSMRGERLGPWLQALQAQLAEARQYEYAALVDIHSWSEIPRDLPLFRSIVVFENYPVEDALRQQLSSLAIGEVRSHEQTNYALTVVSGPGRELPLRIAYDPALFAGDVIGRMLGHLATLLTAMAEGPDLAPGDLPLLTEAERRQLLSEWNGVAPRPSGAGEPRPLPLLHESLAAQARRTPDAPAVVAPRSSGEPENTLTYAELDAWAERIARRLRGHGVRPESVVGLLMNRSPELIASLFAVLKAGGAYLPLDPAYPAARLAMMLADSGAHTLLVQPGVAVPPLPPDVQVLSVGGRETDAGEPAAPDDDVTEADAPRPDSLAYVIYTSGSTGTPKGVMVEHASIANYVSAFIRLTGLGPGDRVIQFVSPSFDAAGEEFFGVLLSGATLVLPPDSRELGGSGLWDFCARQRITFLHMPTAPWHTAVDEVREQNGQIDAPLRLLSLGGDVIDPARLAAFTAALGRAIPFLNLYGPTEATIAATCHESRTDAETGGRVSIGRPLADAQIYVLDWARRPVPAGVAGEIYIGGPGVARGYLNRPDLTEERFIPNPFGEGRLYRTGDLARWAPGTGGEARLDFIGRADGQIKVRGFRVEPGEIEYALKEQPAIREAVVVGQDEPGGAKRLVAYVVAAEGEAVDAGPLREELRRRLPEHMVPARFVLLPGLPVTPTGKVDRRALATGAGPDDGAPASDRGVLLRESGATGPKGVVEELLAGIFAQVLGLPAAAAAGIGPRSSFFDLGGHSLSATRLASRIRDVFGVEIPLRSLFDAPTLEGMAALVAAARNDAPPDRAGIPLLPRDDRGLPLELPPLSFGQQRLWFLDQLEPGNLFYNIPAVVRLTGQLDDGALHAALDAVVARHEVLRTRFTGAGGEPRQVIAPALPLELPLTDLSERPEALREAEARELARAELREPFDLATGPLLRGRLIRLGPEEHLAVLTVHHSVADGWSMGILISELTTAYAALVTPGAPAPALPALPVQYADFAAWQRTWLDDGPDSRLQAQLAYWKQQLAGLPERLDLPTDRPRPAVQTSNGAAHAFTISAELAAALRRLSQQSGVTLFMTLLAGYQALLARYSDQDDIAVGSAIANRTRRELEPLIGFFVNTLVFRTRVDGQITFKDLLGRVREVALGAFAHQDAPFETLVDALQPHRNLSHTPLFQAAFSWQNAPLPALDLPGLTVAPVEIDKGIAGFDMLLQMSEVESAGTIAGAWDYNTDLYDAATIERMANHFTTLLAAAAADPGQALATLPLLTPGERRTLLTDWNATATPYPETTFHGLFAGWVGRTPAATAVEFIGDATAERAHLTYAELDAQAERLARRLRTGGLVSEQGTTLIGIALPRSTDMVVAILAVLKAGAAFLPLDPHYPLDRLAFMVADSGAAAILTRRDVAERLPLSGNLVYVDTEAAAALPGLGGPAPRPRLPDDLAYCIYTSGSTGRPKGALLRHRGLVNLALVQRRAFGMGPGQRVLQFAPFSFDASVWETAMALGNGATLVLTRQETLAEGDALLRFLDAAHITAVTLPPSLLAVLDPPALPDLQTVIAAGERCTTEIVRKWGGQRRFFNAYGPTETTVCATMHPCAPGESWPWGGPPIGAPLSNFHAYVVDRRDQPQPVGVPGELLVGGPALATGYLNRPELTAERFVSAPPALLAPGAAAERLYRTGDLVRWLPGGVLEFLGRLDEQVKVRGFRIEPGEVESVLREHPGVQEAVVAVRSLASQGEVLIGYVVPRDPDGAPSRAELLAHLRGRLPEYMLPALFVTLPALPLTPAGKIDRRALPEPDAADRQPGAAYVAPRSHAEQQIAQWCAELLGLPRVGVDDNFFELGGHSLLATRLIARIRDGLHVELPLRSLFEQPTVGGLAAEAERLLAANKAPSDQAARIAEALKSVRDLSADEIKALLAQKRAAQPSSRPASGGTA